MDRNSKNAWKNHSCTQGTVDVRLIKEKGGFSFFCDAESLGKYSEAEPLYLRSLSIYERQLGADHPYVATSLFCLAALYHNTQRHPQALQSIQRAVQIYEQKLGTEHPTTQNALGWLLAIRDAV
jgi:hypothetical protein